MDVKRFFVGCSGWERHGGKDHLYFPNPLAVNEDTFQFMMENRDLLPDLDDEDKGSGKRTPNATCSYGLHPLNTRAYCRE
jgi:hypothetical protein